MKCRLSVEEKEDNNNYHMKNTLYLDRNAFFEKKNHELYTL